MQRRKQNHSFLFSGLELRSLQPHGFKTQKPLVTEKEKKVPEIKEDRYHNTYVHILALGHSILLSQGIWS